MITQIQIHANSDPNSPVSRILFSDTAIGATTVDSIKSGPAQLFSVTADNTANPFFPSYLSLYNLPSGNITIGTTPSSEILYVPAGQIISVLYITTLPNGQFSSSKPFTVALSASCSNIAGGNVSPTNPVVCTIAYL